MSKIFHWFLIFIPVALALRFFQISPLAVFFVSSLAIIPLAQLIGEATEVLSVHLGPALGGFLNATFGNATEFIIGIFALRSGLVEVVKASITGSIIGNLLLVLGMAMFAGGVLHKKQEFNKTAAQASAATLLLAVIALVMPAIFLQTAPDSGKSIIEELSVVVSILMLVIYGASLWFMLYTHKHLYTEEVGGIRGQVEQNKKHFNFIGGNGCYCFYERNFGGQYYSGGSYLGMDRTFHRCSFCGHSR